MAKRRGGEGEHFDKLSDRGSEGAMGKCHFVLVLMDGTKYAILIPLCNFVLSFEFFVVKTLTIKTLKQNTGDRIQKKEDGMTVQVSGLFDFYKFLRDTRSLW